METIDVLAGLLVDPHTFQEIEAISRIFYRLISPESTDAIHQVIGHTRVCNTENEFVDIILEATQQCGPI